jgi:hypothetical protein
VVLHCGDLTKRSTIAEYKATFSMLRALTAPLKLVIAGNHDLSLDTEYDSDGLFQQEARAVREIVDDARADGVRYLMEGTYEFVLQNGALIKVYASQYTPVFGGWAFQYVGAHDFAIPPGVDVAMTHGPPYGVLDEAGIPRGWTSPNHAGCEHLFKAVARAKPRIHCFGHIHEGWGAYLGTWVDKEVPGGSGTLSVLDQDKSRPVQTLHGLRPMFAADTTGTSPKARQRLAELSEQRGYHVDLTEEDQTAVQSISGIRQTLFVNAAIMDIRYRPSQLPWIIDVELPSAEHSPAKSHLVHGQQFQR